MGTGLLSALISFSHSYFHCHSHSHTHTHTCIHTHTHTHTHTHARTHTHTLLHIQEPLSVEVVSDNVVIPDDAIAVTGYDVKVCYSAIDAEFSL